MILATSQWIALCYLVLGLLGAQFLYTYYYRMLYKATPNFTQYSYFIIAWLPIILIFGCTFICEFIKDYRNNS